MTAKKIIPKVLILVFIVAFGVLCAFTGDITSPVGTLWSLFPPVVAIGLAIGGDFSAVAVIVPLALAAVFSKEKLLDFRIFSNGGTRNYR